MVSFLLKFGVIHLIFLDLLQYRRSLLGRLLPCFARANYTLETLLHLQKKKLRRGARCAPLDTQDHVEAFSAWLENERLNHAAFHRSRGCESGGSGKGIMPAVFVV